MTSCRLSLRRCGDITGCIVAAFAGVLPDAGDQQKSMVVATGGSSLAGDLATIVDGDGKGESKAGTRRDQGVQVNYWAAALPKKRMQRYAVAILGLADNLAL